MNLKLSLEEESFLEMVAVNSALDKKVVKDVLKGFLKTLTINFYGGNKEFYIPYICKIITESFETSMEEGIKFQVKLKAEPCESLIKELKEINEGNITPTEEYLKSQIFSQFLSRVEK